MTGDNERTYAVIGESLNSGYSRKCEALRRTKNNLMNALLSGRSIMYIEKYNRKRGVVVKWCARCLRCGGHNYSRTNYVAA